jgi:hypothetical protein
MLHEPKFWAFIFFLGELLAGGLTLALVKKHQKLGIAAMIMASLGLLLMGLFWPEANTPPVASTVINTGGGGIGGSYAGGGGAGAGAPGGNGGTFIEKQYNNYFGATPTPLLSAEVEHAVEGALRSAGPHPVKIMIQAGDKFADACGTQWLKILKAAGWMKANDSAGSIFPFGSPYVGLSFEAHGPNMPEGLRIFAHVLTENHIPYNHKAKPVKSAGYLGNDTNAFVLIVGIGP